MDRDLAFQSYLQGALDTFGIAADEGERAVMTGIWSVYEPSMDMLRDADLEGIEPERAADLSKPPER